MDAAWFRGEKAKGPFGWRIERVPVTCRLNTADEVTYFNDGGILHHVLRRLLM